MSVSKLQPIADRLRDALEAGGESYALALAEHWADQPVDLSHEPPLPQDAPTNRDEMLAERRMLDRAFHSLMPDFGYKNLYARIVGEVIYLFCDQVGTLPDGVKVDSPLCSRFTIENGKIAKVVLAIDMVSVAPLYAAFSAMAGAQPEGAHA